MATQVGVTGVCIVGVAVIAVENIVVGHDPFPQLMAGGLFTAGCSVVSEINTDLAMGVAITFLTATLVLHSTAITNLLTSLASQNKATPGRGRTVPSRPHGPTST